MKYLSVFQIVSAFLILSAPAYATNSEISVLCRRITESAVDDIHYYQRKGMKADEVKKVLYDGYGGTAEMPPYIRAVYEEVIKVVYVMVDDSYSGAMYGTTGDAFQYMLKCFDEMDKHADRFARLEKEHRKR